MTDLAPLIQKLRQLGLTRTEAEVYVAVLQESGPGPVSGYKVAQAMGKDPANLGKTLAALEKHGAVRAIQDKPRLYLPVLPADFTNALVGRMKEVGESLVTQLEQFSRPQPTGLTLSLPNNVQALDQAIALMRSCVSELLIFSSRDVIDYLGREFGELASRGNSKVRFLGLEPSGIALAENTVISLPAGFSNDGSKPWLQMVVDRRAWLVAQFNRDANENLPCGWWGDDPAMASIMGAALNAACDGVPYEFKPPAAPIPDPDFSEPEDKAPSYDAGISEEEPEFESGFMTVSATTESTDAQEPQEIISEPEPQPEPSEPETPPEPEKKPILPPEDEGFTFVVRHEDEGDQAGDL